MVLHIGQNSCQGAGKPALHIASAASPQHVISNLRRERIKAPLACIAHRHNICMSGKQQIRRASAYARIEIINIGRARLRKAQGLRLKASLLQHVRNVAQSAAIMWRDRRKADELLGNRQSILTSHAHAPIFSLALACHSV